MASGRTVDWLVEPASSSNRAKLINSHRGDASTNAYCGRAEDLEAAGLSE
jgi:hypothetical protein